MQSLIGVWESMRDPAEESFEDAQSNKDEMTADEWESDDGSDESDEDDWGSCAEEPTLQATFNYEQPTEVLPGLGRVEWKSSTGSRIWTIPVEGFRWDVREDKQGALQPSKKDSVGLELPQVISLLERGRSQHGMLRMSEPNGIDYAAVTSRPSRQSAQCCFDGAVWRLYPKDAGAREYPAESTAAD